MSFVGFAKKKKVVEKILRHESRGFTENGEVWWWLKEVDQRIEEKEVKWGFGKMNGISGYVETEWVSEEEIDEGGQKEDGSVNCNNRS